VFIADNYQEFRKSKQRRDWRESGPILGEGNDVAETNEDRLDPSGEDPVVETSLRSRDEESFGGRD